MTRRPFKCTRIDLTLTSGAVSRVEIALLISSLNVRPGDAIYLESASDVEGEDCPQFVLRPSEEAITALHGWLTRRAPQDGDWLMVVQDMTRGRSVP